MDFGLMFFSSVAAPSSGEPGGDEIACLIDFLDDTGAVLAGLDSLDEVRSAFSAPAVAAASQAAAASFLEEL